MKQGRKRLYYAAPLFSDGEKSANLKIVAVLERWCDVFLPQRDGALVPRLIEQGMSPSRAYEVVFERDVNALCACDGLVINLDGRVIDEGAAFELGYAHALRKTCVGFRTDVRVLLPWGLNPMVRVPLVQIFEAVDDIEAWAKVFATQETSHRVAS